MYPFSLLTFRNMPSIVLYRLRLIKEMDHLGFVTVNMAEILSSRLMNDNVGDPIERARKVTGLFEEVRTDKPVSWCMIAMVLWSKVISCSDKLENFQSSTFH